MDTTGTPLYTYFDDCKLASDPHEKVKVGMECPPDGDSCTCLVDGLDWRNRTYKLLTAIVH